VFGFLSGKAFELLGNFAEGIAIKSIPFGPEDAGFEEVSFGASKIITAPGMEWTRQIQGVDIIVDPEMASAVRSAKNLLRMGGDAANEGFEQLDAVAKIIRSAEYRQNIIDTLEITRKELIKNDSLAQFIRIAKEGLQAVSQGAVAASTGSNTKTDKKENLQIINRPLSEGQVYLVFNRITESQLNEGPMDAIKGLAGKVMNKARTVGTNLTTKITADKLNSAWQKVGSPTDSEELKKFLTGQGVDATAIDTVYKSMKIASGNAQAATSLYAQVKTDLAKLDKKSKQRLSAYLQKQLGTA
jgi:lipopolysaccharide biosynthesis regulator YciM